MGMYVDFLESIVVPVNYLYTISMAKKIYQKT